MVRLEAVELVPHRRAGCRRLEWNVELADKPSRSELGGAVFRRPAFDEARHDED